MVASSGMSWLTTIQVEAKQSRIAMPRKLGLVDADQQRSRHGDDEIEDGEAREELAPAVKARQREERNEEIGRQLFLVDECREGELRHPRRQQQKQHRP